MLRLALAPVYLDSELGFVHGLGPQTDFAIGAAGGGGGQGRAVTVSHKGVAVLALYRDFVLQVCDPRGELGDRLLERGDACHGRLHACKTARDAVELRVHVRLHAKDGVQDALIGRLLLR